MHIPIAPCFRHSPRDWMCAFNKTCSVDSQARVNAQKEGTPRWWGGGGGEGSRAPAKPQATLSRAQPGSWTGGQFRGGWGPLTLHPSWEHCPKAPCFRQSFRAFATSVHPGCVHGPYAPCFLQKPRLSACAPQPGCVHIPREPCVLQSFRWSTFVVHPVEETRRTDVDGRRGGGRGGGAGRGRGRWRATARGIEGERGRLRQIAEREREKGEKKKREKKRKSEREKNQSTSEAASRRKHMCSMEPCIRAKEPTQNTRK